MYQITLDGPAGSGKSTLAKEIAQKLNITYLDTGAMYRAFTYLCLNNKVNLISDAEIIAQLDLFNLELTASKVLVNNSDVTAIIREDHITKNVSRIAEIKQVRVALVEKQREIAKGQSIVMDGRDIGTVVLPNAQYKFYITASDEERARRRHRELIAKGSDISFTEVLEDIKRRDNYDMNRVNSPLKPASDASIIDTTEMTIDEIVDFICKRVKDV